MKSSQVKNIVFLGFDLGSFHAYKTLYPVIKQEVKLGKTRLWILHSTENFYFNGWGTEIATEIIQPKNVSYSLKRLFPEAKLIIGRIIGLHQESNQVNIEESGKGSVFIHYNHLIISRQAFQTPQPGHWQLLSNPSHQKEINSRLQNLVTRAAGAKTILEARKFFQLVIAGNLYISREWALQISKYLKDLCTTNPSLQGVQPVISLVGKCFNCFSIVKHRSPLIEKFAEKQLNQHGIYCFEDQEIVRQNVDGVVLLDGRFIACHLFFNCEDQGALPNGFADLKISDDHRFFTDKYSRLVGKCNIWAINKQAKNSLQYEEQTVSYQLDSRKKGKHLGLNLANALACKMLQPYQNTSSLQLGSLGPGKGLIKWENWSFTGSMAQWLRLFLLLKAMPTSKSAFACMGDWLSFFIWNRQRVTMQTTYLGTEKTGYQPAI